MSEDAKELKEGYIYIMCNEVFNYYGDDVFKIGKAVDIGKRMHGYTTSYLSNVEVKFISEICSDYTLAEKAIFTRLSSNRIRPNREFIKGDLELLIQTIEEVVKKVNDKIITSYDIQPNKIHKPKHDDLVYNFACLFDEDNIQANDDVQHSLDLTKVKYVLKIIDMLGFSSIYDRTLIKQDVFQTKINNVIEFLSNEHTANCKQFNLIMSKTKHNIKRIEGKSLKALLGYINSFLSSFSIKIINCRKHERSYVNKTNYYKIEFLNNIDELLEDRIDNGYALQDKETTFIKPSAIPNYMFKYKEL